MIKPLFRIFFIIILYLFTSTIQGYTKYEVNTKKNLFDQYINAYENAEVICPKTEDPKVNSKLQEEFSVYYQQAKNGDSKAEYKISLAYLNGIGTHADLREGINWLDKAVSKGYAPAKVTYAALLLFKKKIFGNLISNPPSENEMIKWIEHSADQNDISAQLLLELLYMEKNEYKRAFYLAEPKAKKGYSSEQYVLGNMYYYGLGFQKNYTNALYWYQKALKQDPPLLIFSSVIGNIIDIYSKPPLQDNIKSQYWEKKLNEFEDIFNCQNN